MGEGQRRDADLTEHVQSQGKQLKAKGERWWGQTHLHGPHQSVCWLRPKRARHFLGEPGSAHSHAIGALQSRGRAGRQQGRAGPRKRGNISVSSHRHPTAPTAEQASPWHSQPQGEPKSPQAKVSGKVGHPAGQWRQPEEYGVGREGTYEAVFSVT